MKIFDCLRITDDEGDVDDFLNFEDIHTEENGEQIFIFIDYRSLQCSHLTGGRTRRFFNRPHIYNFQQSRSTWWKGSA